MLPNSPLTPLKLMNFGRKESGKAALASGVLHAFNSPRNNLKIRPTTFSVTVFDGPSFLCGLSSAVNDANKFRE